MRTYKVHLIYKDFDNPNNIDHKTEHFAEVSEELFNIIYKLLL